ncbi:MAG TPA: serine/threonine-protein kinase [Humisphaera sp.]
MAPGLGSAGGASAAVDSEVARIVVDAGLVTRQELDYCREQQKQSSDPNQRSLADLLIENSFLTATQARRIRSQVEDKDTSQIPGYTLICRVGKGAMATVYKARQNSLDRIVAVKVLPKRMSDNAEFVERFYKEGRAAARLSHNYIVQAIDVGSSPKGYHYFVMEFVEGKTLYDMMAAPPHGDGHRFSEAEALDIMIQMADALSHAHQRGLIHRDVKPKNILMTPEGVSKLTDMGLARATDDTVAAQSEAGKAYGTPYYISPEQIRGDVDIDHRADIYSLGATMYHLLTGRPPFEADTPAAVMHKHLKSPLTPPDHVNTALSAGVGEIIEVAMAKKREDRYHSMADMLADLQAVRAGGQPEFARRVATVDDLAQLEATGKTIDIAPPRPARVNVWKEPAVLVIAAVAGLSVVANLILLAMLAGK